MRAPLSALLSWSLRNHSDVPVWNDALLHPAEAPAFIQERGMTAWDASAASPGYRAALYILVGVVSGCIVAVITWLIMQHQGWPRRPSQLSGGEEASARRSSAAGSEDDSPPQDLEEVKKRRQSLTTELEKLREMEKNMAHEAGEAGEPLMPGLESYDDLLRTLMQEAMQRVGPTLQRGQAIRTVAETRATNFVARAKTFLLNELNGAAGELCEALDAPEAMLLLDLDAATATHFPPLSLLLSGLLTPYVLEFMVIMHISQLLLVLVPYGIMATWALSIDWESKCVAIPGIREWLYVQLGLIYLLTWARLIIVLQIREGQMRLALKSQRARDAHHARREAHLESGSGTVQGLMDLRELFVSQAALIQEVLLVEDRVRQGIARHIVGFFTLVWLGVTVWTLVIVLRYALVPGQVEFFSPRHVSPDHYCGMWATVLTARISCLVAALVFGTNLATVCHWLVDVVFSSKRFSAFVMNHAQEFDEGLLGLPVAQILAKAFILRDSSDLTFTRLAVALHERTNLTSELKDTETKLEYLRLRLEEKEAAVAKLKGEVETTRAASGAASGSSGSMDWGNWAEAWRQRGQEAIAAAQQQVTEVQSTGTADFDRAVQRVTEATEQLRQSSAVGAALQEADSMGRRIVDSVPEDRGRQHLERGREAIQSALERSGPTFHSVLSQVMETGQRVGQQVAEQVKEFSPEVVERGQEAMGRLREMSPDVAERVEQARSGLMGAATEPGAASSSSAAAAGSGSTEETPAADASSAASPEQAPAAEASSTGELSSQQTGASS